MLKTALPRALIAAFVFVCLALPVRAQENACGAGHLVTIEPDGSASRGSKERLRRAVENGVPVRVGWILDSNADGVPELTHWTDAGFLTGFEGEVFAQIDDIQRQMPARGQARVLMPPGRQRWTGLVSTNGRLEGHFDDGSEPQSTRVRSTWCVDPRAPACTAQWRMVYRHDADGRALDGSKQALLDAVRRGAALRLAWGFSGSQPGEHVTVEHAAEPVFLTIVNGEEVFVQVPEHIGQASYAEIDKARFDRSSVMWRGLLGTDGTFDAVTVDRATGQEVRRLAQRAGLAWFAEVPGPECDAQAPLTLAVPGGVRPK
jgi:hypothetical protein